MQYLADPTDLLRAESEALLAGIVLDTKNFTMRTGGRTFEAAAFLRRAGAEVVIAGVGGVRLTGSHGIKITADLPAEEIRPADYDMVILPGGMPGTKNLDASAARQRKKAGFSPQSAPRR